MSQNAKRKTGSRRRLANESKPSESDEFRVTERTSVVQQENAEDVDAPGNSDFSPSDSQNPLSLNVSKNRRKLGSSRRNKGRQHAKDSAAESYPTVAGEHIGNTNNGEPVGTTEIPLTESEVVHQVKEEVCDDTLVGVSNVTSSGLHSSPTLDQPLKSQSCFTEMPEELPSTFSVVEGEDDAEKLRQDGKLHDTQLGTESHLKSEDTLSDSFVEPEIVTVAQTDNESVDEAELESSKDKISSDKDYKEEEVLSQGRESLHSVVSEVHTEDEKPTEMPPFVMSSIGEAESFLQSLQSELDYPLYCQSQDNSMKIDEERHISLNPVENKINTGDSQRYEGLEEVGEDTEVTAKGTGAIEALETACLEEAIERTFEKESKPVCNDGFVMDSTQESLLYAAAKASYPEIENAYKTRNPEANLESLIPKNENLQGEHDEGKADFEVGDCDNSVEDVIEGADNGDSLQSQEVRGLNNSENVANNDKCEIKATQIDDVSVSSESVTCYATQNREKMSDSLMDPAEITYQTELSTDDSSTKQQGSNPNDKHATNKFCAIDIMTPPISGTERASGEMYKTDDLVEDDLKSSGELEKGVSSEMEDTYSSSRTLRSKIDACLDSQENDTNLNLIGNRRKLGSSRRNKGRQHAEDSAAESYRRVLEEQIGNTNNGEPVGTTEIPLTESEVVHQVKEEVCDDTLVGISDVTSSGLHSSPTLDQPLKSQSCFTEMPEELPSTFSVVEGEDDDEKLRQDGKLHDTQLGTESHLKSEDTLSDSFVEPEIVTVVQTDNESVDEAELESSKDKISSDKDYKEEEVLSQGRESLHSVVSEVHTEDEKPTEMPPFVMSSIGEAESFLQSLQSELDYPLYCQSQDNSMKIDEERHISLNPVENKINTGDSQRYEGLEEVGEDTEVTAKSTGAIEALETACLEEAIERTFEKESKPVCNDGFVMDSTQESLLYAAAKASYPEIENAYKTRNPEANLESLIPKNENLQGEHDEGKADFEVGDCDNSVEDVIEGADNGDSLQSQEVRGLNNSENVANNDKCEIKATQIDDVSVSSESVTCYATQNREKMSDSLMDPAEITYQTELSTDDSSTKQQGSNPNDKHATNKFCAIDIMTPPISGTERASGEMYKTDDLVEDDLKSSGELEKGVSSEMEDTYSSSRTLRSKIDACLDSQENDTNLNLIGNRRKLGSSRRNKGRQHAEDSAAESYRRVLEEQIGNTNNGEPVGTTEIPLTESEVVHQVKEEVCDDTLVGISDVTSSGLHSSPTLDQPLKSQSYFTEMPEELPSTFSVVEGEDDDEKLRQDGKLHDTQLGTESHLKSEDTLSDSFVEPEIVTVAQTDNESVDEAELESSKDKISSDKDYKEEEVLSQVSESLHSVVSELHKEEEEPTQTQEICQIDYEKSESSLQSLQPETIYPLPYQDRDSSMGTVEEPPTVFGSIGSRRKLGSSRRNKGQQRVKAAETYHQPKEELMDKTKDEEELDSTKRLLMMMTMQKESIQETEVDQEINPTVTVDRDSKTMPEENADLSQNVANNQIVTTDISLCSGEEDSLTSTINSEDLSQLVRYGSVSLGPVKSPEDDLGLRNISHDNNVAATLVTLEDLQQDAANQIQREVLSHDKGSFGHDDNVQQTNGEIENVRETRVERSIDAHVSGQQETLENPEDPTNKAPETTSSPEVANAELRSAAHNKSIPSASLCMQEILRAELVLDERTAVRTCDGQQVREEEAHLDEDFQGKSKQKRRKMGSTRWSHLYKKPEEDMDNKAEIKENVNMQVGEKMVVSAEVPRNENTEASVKTVYEQGETKETSVCQDKGTKQQSSTSKLQSRESNITSHTDSSLLTTLLPAQSASAREDDVTFVQVADLQDGDGNMDVSVELSQLGDFVVPEAHITSCSVNPVPHSNTNETINPFITGGSFEPSCEATENDEERLECGNVTQQQALNSPEEAIVAADLKMVSSEVGVGTREEHKDPRSTILDPNNTIEGVPQKSLETENSSCALNMANRRRKMGSTRRNLRSPREQEDLHQQQDVDNKTAEADVNIRTGSLKDSDSEQAEGKASEALDSSESQSKPVFHHEEHPVSLGQIAETDHQLSPSHFPAVPATPPEHDVVSETAAGGRRRKLGSHRKSHGPQSYDSSRGERETQNGGSTVEESPIRTTLDKISEVDGSDQRVSADTSLSSAGEHMKPMSERSLAQGTPVQHLPTEIHFSQERPVALSLGHGSGAEGLKSDSYNVILVGDSCVGKTSFMRRAQTGGFPLDVPMSVGLDTCMCTVVVDGKCVVLQFWDTVGQERYHSITRQIFHKAQAFLLMYDITSSRSFSAVSYWANCIQEGASENVIILLLGNKIDCAKRQVTTQDGEILAKEYNFKFMECSAVTGENVTQSLETVARMLSEKSEVRRETTQLHKEPPQKKSSGCC